MLALLVSSTCEVLHHMLSKGWMNSFARKFSSCTHVSDLYVDPDIEQFIVA